MRQLHTIEEVITELGGFDAVKELTKRSSNSAVPMWKSRKKFPPNTFTVMRAALEAMNASAPEALWGMPSAQKADNDA